MPLIKIFNEKLFFEKAQRESLFRPSGFSILFITEGDIELEINGEPVIFDKEHLVLISPRNIYKLKNYNESLKMHIVIHNRAAIREIINFDFNLVGRIDLLKHLAHFPHGLSYGSSNSFCKKAIRQELVLIYSCTFCHSSTLWFVSLLIFSVSNL